MSRKAVFIDIDGTLTHRIDAAPSPVDCDAMRRALAQGHLVLLCTGRSLRCIPAVVKKSVPYCGLVAGGGAYVELHGEVLRNITLSEPVLGRTAALFLDSGIPCVFEGVEDMFYTRDIPYREPDWLPVTRPDDFMNRYAGRPINKLTIAGVPDDRLARELRRDYNLILHPQYAEALPLGCHKAVGMAALLERAKLGTASTIAIGDSDNDLDMLSYAGIGIAMGNAPEHVKAAADAVTADVRQNGVAAAINRYLLTSSAPDGEMP